MESVPQFGEAPPGSVLRERPSAYGLIKNDHGRVLVCRTPECVMLPGGGIDPGETPEQAMRREVSEETGLTVIAARLLCQANQLIMSRDGSVCFNKIGSYFLATAEDRGYELIELDHVCLWLDPAEAATTLSDEAHRWAVTRMGTMVRDDRRASTFGGEIPC